MSTLPIVSMPELDYTEKNAECFLRINKIPKVVFLTKSIRQMPVIFRSETDSIIFGAKKKAFLHSKMAVIWHVHKFILAVALPSYFTLL